MSDSGSSGRRLCTEEETEATEKKWAEETWTRRPFRGRAPGPRGPLPLGLQGTHTDTVGPTGRRFFISSRRPIFRETLKEGWTLLFLRNTSLGRTLTRVKTSRGPGRTFLGRPTRAPSRTARRSGGPPLPSTRRGYYRATKGTWPSSEDQRSFLSLDPCPSRPNDSHFIYF